MLKRFLVVLNAFALVSLFAGCVHTPQPAGTPLTAPGDLMYEELNTTERFRKYNSVGIRLSTEGVAFLSTDAGERLEMEGFSKSVPDYLAQGFIEEMEDNFYKKYGVVRTDEDAKSYDLIIDGKFVELDRGNAAGRFWGVGGLTHVSVSGTMTETATGKVVVNFRDFKTGGSGGDSLWLMRSNAVEVGRNISDFLEEVY
ncbi:MAG TPA: DUF4410 domain-containing protein [Nitrospirota bacterium]|nr:DUF4410 domain-containing protein [Nitrospirota bacterium]